MASSRIADSVGRVLGDRYRLTRPLGVGASAHVYAAEDVRLRRRVAVKVLHPALAGEEAFLRRFRRESQAVAALRHPNILRVYDWGEDGGTPYLVMELLEGGSLRSMLDRGARLSPEQAAAVGAEAARALDYAHRQGFVHRDIKPANLLFDDEGRVSVADFGLARALAEATWTEPAGAVVGTARYASPELVRGEHLDSKADVYSLALVLVEAVTGQVPFVADTAFGTLMARVGRDLEVSEELGPLKPVLEAAGVSDPAARMDAGALARALTDVGVKLPLPAPLPLAAPLEAGFVERDEVSPTEFPGRTKLFDRAEWEDDEGSAPEAVPAPPAVAAGAHGGAVVAGTVASHSAPGGSPAGAGPAGGPASGTAVGGPAQGFPPSTGAPAWPAAGPDRPDGQPGDQPAPPRSRRRLRRAALIAAVVLLLLGGSGAAWAVLSGRLKPMEPVPRLVGRTQSDAAAALTSEHLRLAVSGRSYSPTVAAGSVLSQVQPPGKRLRQDSTVQVVLSLGPQPVPVPNLRNDDLQAAEQVLQSLGLKWTTTSRSDMSVPAGRVIGNTPDSGTLVPGQTVAIVVSTGKPQVAVPAIALGTESYADAAAALAKAGFTVHQGQDWSNTVPKGAVISVTPPSGTLVTIGGTVNVVVSQGPHYVAVPSVKDDSVGAASQALSAAGFNVAGVQGNPVNTVKGTDPPAGSQVLYGSSVTIVTK